MMNFRMTVSYSSSSITYGNRAKIGVIVPPTNTVNEVEWNLMAPDGVSIHSTRMPLHADTTSDTGKKALYNDIEQATLYLAPARLSAIAYGCTAGSMVLPLTKLTNFMENLAEAPCVTTAASIVMALRALKISKVALATPYHDELNQHEVDFLRKVGIAVKHEQGLGIGANGPQEYIKIAQTPEKRIFEHILSTDCDKAGGMVVSCTDFPVLGMIPELEKRMGKPVITSNQATFWAVLRAAGIKDQFENFGTLLRHY